MIGHRSPALFTTSCTSPSHELIGQVFSIMYVVQLVDVNINFTVHKKNLKIVTPKCTIMLLLLIMLCATVQLLLYNYRSKLTCH